MAGRKTDNAIAPDIDDLDGQIDGAGKSTDGNGGEGNERRIDGKPVTSIDGIAGDDFARDGDGNVLRNKDGSPRRKRGRKSGRSYGGSNKQNGARNNQTLNDAVNTLSSTLMIIHAGLASFTKFEEMALTEDESKALASATVNVLDQFDVQPDPRVTAVVGLVTTAGTIYGPRYYLYKQHKKAEKEKEAKDNSPQYLGPLTTVQNG